MHVVIVVLRVRSVVSLLMNNASHCLVVDAVK